MKGVKEQIPSTNPAKRGTKQYSNPNIQCPKRDVLPVLNFDKLVKSAKVGFSVIPAKAGI
jgi:hypothetical protein